MLYLKVLALIFMISGFASVYLAKYIVNKYNLKERAVCSFEADLTEEELEEYKYNKAIVNVKIFGALVALPGVILILIVFSKGMS
nr:hypothetical protein [Acetivibrio cellulolyticus]